MDKSGVDVAVVIPTYNRIDLVGRALQSVQAQSLNPSEIIVVDDGSTDGTESYIRENFPGITLIRQPNRGVSAARNAGIRAATSQWVAFLDSDDEWLNDKLEKQVQALRGNAGYLACHCDEKWMRNGIRVNPARKHAKPAGWIYEQCLPLCCVSPSAVVIARETLMDVGLFDEGFPACEDYDMWLRLFSRIPILFVNELLVVKYGGHDDQLSRAHWGMDRFRVTSLVRMLKQKTLTPQQQEATRRVLESKLDILIAGADKRQKLEESQHYQTMKNRWCVGRC